MPTNWRDEVTRVAEVIAILKRSPNRAESINRLITNLAEQIESQTILRCEEVIKDTSLHINLDTDEDLKFIIGQTLHALLPDKKA